MSKFEFEFSTDEFEKNLNKYVESTLPKKNKEGIKKACLIVEREGKELCPVDFGQLRASITNAVKKDTGYVGTNVEYAVFVHEGTGIFASRGNGRKTPWVYRNKDGKFVRTVGQKPKPFLLKAMHNKREEVKNALKNSILGG